MLLFSPRWPNFLAHSHQTSLIQCPVAWNASLNVEMLRFKNTVTHLTNMSADNIYATNQEINWFAFLTFLRNTLESYEHIKGFKRIFFYFPDTRETAFLHAISSAGVLHQVTQSCSLGHLPKCYCDRHLRGKNAKLQLKVQFLPPANEVAER